MPTAARSMYSPGGCTESFSHSRSSLRKQGPIATGSNCLRDFLPYRPIDRSRGMGPCVRTDDVGRESRSPKTDVARMSEATSGKTLAARQVDPGYRFAHPATQSGL